MGVGVRCGRRSYGWRCRYGAMCEGWCCQERNGTARNRWCRGTELNCRHQPFQGCALPTELPRHLAKFILVPSSSPEIKTRAYASHALAVNSTRIGTGETGSLGGAEEHLQETAEDDTKSSCFVRPEPRTRLSKDLKRLDRTNRTKGSGNA